LKENIKNSRHKLQELDTHPIEVKGFDNKGFPDFSYSSLRAANFAARQSQSMVGLRG
jgi:hypothetical protein